MPDGIRLVRSLGKWLRYWTVGFSRNGAIKEILIYTYIEHCIRASVKRRSSIGKAISSPGMDLFYSMVYNENI